MAVLARNVPNHDSGFSELLLGILEFLKRIHRNAKTVHIGPDKAGRSTLNNSIWIMETQISEFKDGYHNAKLSRSLLDLNESTTILILYIKTAP